MNRDSRTNSLEPLTAVPCRGNWKQISTDYHAESCPTNSYQFRKHGGEHNQQKDMVKIGKNSVDINHTCIFTLVYIDTNTWKRILHTAVTAVKTHSRNLRVSPFMLTKAQIRAALRGSSLVILIRDSQKGQVDSCKSELFDVAKGFLLYYVKSSKMCRKSIDS